MIGWSQFALDRHVYGSGFSFFKIPEEAVINRVDAAWQSRFPGTGETGLDRKILVPVNPEGFFTSIAPLQEGMPVRAQVTRRQNGEDFYVETFIDPYEAKHLGIEPQAAKRCNIVCYSAEALLENGGARTTNEPWEIVAVLASDIEIESMEPLTMARNFLEKVGGTKSIYTAQEFAEAIYNHSTRGIKIKDPIFDLKREIKTWTPEETFAKFKEYKKLSIRQPIYRNYVEYIQSSCVTHIILKDGDSAVCGICGSDHGWYCPDSPDHICYYDKSIERDGKHYIQLMNEQEVEIDHERDSWSESCAFCGEPEERK